MGRRQLLEDLPLGSLILVTGGTKPIALQVIKQLLEHNYRVRTTTGVFANTSWLDHLFAKYADWDMFEHLRIGDPSSPGAFREAVRGVDAIVHAPTVPLIGPHVDKVAQVAVGSVWSILNSALEEPSVRAFVYTSSIVAATPLAPSVNVWVGPYTWNTEDASMARSNRGGTDCVYNASFCSAESAFWRWAEFRRPHFKVNVISAGNLIGQNFGSQHTSDWKNWIFELYQNGEAEKVPGIDPTKPHWYVDVQDVALFHIAALQDPLIRDKRIQAWGTLHTWNDAVCTLQSLDDSCRYLPFFTFQHSLSGMVNTDMALQRYILHRWAGTPCWKSFRATVVESLAVFRERAAEQVVKD